MRVGTKISTPPKEGDYCGLVDDGGLLTGICAGDARAWSELVDRHSGVVWRMARTVVNDDALATDAMQTAWLRLLEHADRIQNPAGVRSWLITTARREALALSKAQARQQASDPTDWKFDEPTSDREDPAATGVSTDERTTLIAELRKLSAKCQELLTLHAHQVTYDEIAEVMSMAIGSIGPTKARCLEKLRRSKAIRNLEVGT